MKIEPLPFRSPIAAYERQAEALLAGHRGGDPAAIDLFHRKHPRFLDEKIQWLPKSIPDAEIRDAALSLDDARLAVARGYDFLDWPSLAAYVAAVAQDGPVFEFESAVEAVVRGDLEGLRAALRRNPGLTAARSTRVCCFDPPVHGATLLHYVAANGVEGYHQKTFPQAVEVARALLEAGAEPDAEAQMYGTQCTTMSLLVSSSHPAKAGLQVPLIELLLDHGAAIEGRGANKWGGPLHTALAFGMLDAARALAKRGAQVDLAAAAGLGRTEEVARLLPDSFDERGPQRGKPRARRFRAPSAIDGHGPQRGCAARPASARHRALSLAAQHGHVDVVRLLLDQGENPNRYNPEGNHPHSTPLHQAVLGGHAAVVRLLLDRGARLDIRDTIWHGTPLGWAKHGGGKAQTEMAELLRSRGAMD